MSRGTITSFSKEVRYERVSFSCLAPSSGNVGRKKAQKRYIILCILCFFAAIFPLFLRDFVSSWLRGFVAKNRIVVEK
jgi:hypothetical protein